MTNAAKKLAALLLPTLDDVRALLASGRGAFMTTMKTVMGVVPPQGAEEISQLLEKRMAPILHAQMIASVKQPEFYEVYEEYMSSDEIAALCALLENYPGIFNRMGAAGMRLSPRITAMQNATLLKVMKEAGLSLED